MPIGDVTLASDSLPIVIGDFKFRRKGIAKIVVQTLLVRARELGWEKINLKGIHKDNIAFQVLFESYDFKRYCSLIYRFATLARRTPDSFLIILGSRSKICISRRAVPEGFLLPCSQALTAAGDTPKKRANSG